MLCCITAAWAGEGDGSKEHPYTGEWTVNSLLEVVKKGDHLGYNCVIKGEGGSVRVFDTKVNYSVVENWKEWAVGTLISKDPFKCYAEYCKYNDEDVRTNQTFIVTTASRSNLDAKKLILEGYYSGFYTQHEAEGYIPVKTASELKSVIQKNKAAKVLLGTDIDISGLGTICDKFTGTISGSHMEFNILLDTLVNKSYILRGSGYVKDLTQNSAKDTYLFESVEGATFEHLMFQNVSVKKSSDNVGVIALTATNTTFRAVIMDHVSVYDGDDNAGTFVGTANGCRFIATFVNYSEVYTGGHNSGGLVGTSNSSEYMGCIVFANCGVYADGTIMTGFMEGVDARAGGVVGESTKDKFFACTNQALVGGLCDGLGGIVGYSDGSEFLRCKNYGTVCHCEYTGEGKELFFRATIEDIRERMKNITQSQVEEILNAVEAGCNSSLGTIVALSVADAMLKLAVGDGLADLALLDINAYIDSLFTVDEWVAIIDNPSWDAGELYAFESGIVAETFLIVVVAAAIAGAIIYDIVTDYDNVGGICGEARNSSFEMCSNYADLRNDDESGGGIVGYGGSVVINNCYNSGRVYHDGSTLNGGIIGTINHGKVTNCVSVAEIAQPIIGGAWGEHTEWIDQTSGNNYRLRGGRESDVPDCEREVSKQLLHYGLVSLWLNNGVENREKGIRPWHQNLWAREGSDGEEIARDMYPVLIASHDEVNADLFYDATYSTIVYRIHDADGLKAFADLVNSGTSADDYQFRVACLENDINMEGVDWTPIGKDEDYKNFRGIFNGRGHKITGLTCSSINQPVGLIGTAFANAVICNVTIGEGSSFTCEGEAGAGGIVGKVKIRGRDWGTVVIENCGSHANVSGYKHAGGILGNVDTPDDNANIKVYVNNCYSTGTVTAEYGNSALLCGYMKNNGVVSNSWSSGQLRNGKNKGIWPYSWENDNKVAECLVGYFDNRLDINNCYIVNPENNVDRYGEKPLQSGVTVCTSDELAIGRMTYLLNRSNALRYKELIWQQNVGNDDIPSVGNKGNYHTRDRKVGSRYGTVCLPFPVQSNDKITYYMHWGDRDITDSEGVKLQFEYYEKPIPEGTAVLYRVNDENSTTVCFDCADPQTFRREPANVRGMYDWSMFGTYDEQKVFTYETNPSSKEIYYLSGDEIRNAKKTTIAPYRGYFVGPSIEELTANGASQARIRFVIEEEDGSTADIELVGADLVSAQKNSKTYSLMGTVVNDNYRGIVIKNGKKVINN